MILSIHTGHDANMTLSSENEIILYVEFEKVVKERFFRFKSNIRFEDEYFHWISPFISPYIHLIKQINFCWLSDFQKDVIKNILPNRIYCEKKHHTSHAYSLYAFTKPHPEDLIISFDGGGDENDFFKAFNWQENKINLIDEFNINLGTPYRILGLVSRELNSTPVFEFETNLHLPGKIMGLHSLGKLEQNYIEPLRTFYRKFDTKILSIKDELKSLLSILELNFDENLKVDYITSRNLLYTSQYVFEQLFFENVLPYLKSDKYNRILLVGGCSLNVRLNSKVYNFSGKNVFISPVSGDCGISLGAAISDFDLSEYSPFENAFIGLSYSGDLSKKTMDRKGIKVDEKILAKLLFEGNIIATMIGKSEAGPRSLGNRSLLASPLVKNIKDKLNLVKERESFRPIAPIVREESQNKYFNHTPSSKYMTFSPVIKEEFAKFLSEIVHYDNTCRIQTVTKNESFLYELLTEFKILCGYDILINTSFNIKGKPIVNDIEDAFYIFDNTDIDYLYIDGYLFSKS